MKNIIKRNFSLARDYGSSVFIFGPRGVGKTTWLKNFLEKDDIYIDLLEHVTFSTLLTHPENLEQMIPHNFDPESNWIVIDEVQKVPEILNEVHRLIESRKIRFILTGSSARTLRKQGVNLLAGRAHLKKMFPLTLTELLRSELKIDLDKVLSYGLLPSVIGKSNDLIQSYLQSYISAYLTEEIKQEGLARSLPSFSRFLEIASFSQGSVINYSEIARECYASRHAVMDYFNILDDLMIAHRVPAFTKRAKRRMLTKDKFYFFDAGIYHTIRPKGKYDRPEEIFGISLETLILQELLSLNEYLSLGLKIYYWRTASGMEVDFVLYGEKKMIAIEVKHTDQILPKHTRHLRSFMQDYPEAKSYVVYRGSRKLYLDNKIIAMPVLNFIKEIRVLLSS